MSNRSRARQDSWEAIRLLRKLITEAQVIPAGSEIMARRVKPPPGDRGFVGWELELGRHLFSLEDGRDAVRADHTDRRPTP